MILSDVGTIVGGGTPSTKNLEYWDGDIPWLTPKDLSTHTDVYISRGERNITESGLKGSSARLMPKGSVLFSSRAPIGYVAIAQNDICTNQGFKSIVPNEDTNSEYLYYWLKHNKAKIENLGTGTTFKEVSGTVMKNLEIDLPDLETQQRIAETLSALDDKIATNNRANKVLEEMAQAIFEDYQKCGKGTESTISEIADFNTDSYNAKDNWDYVDYLDTGSITNGTISSVQRIDLSQEKLPSRAKRKVKANDIVYSTVRPNQNHFGIITKPVDNMLVSTGFAVIRSNHPAICNEYIYLLLTQAEVIAKLHQLAEQSVSAYPSIRPSDIGKCEILVPSNEDGAVLHEQLAPIFKAISANQHDNVCLAEMRDSLLPRLMSGEIKVEKEI
jgi:type I restriction enzyme S subunit